jgi:hypothetical protein
MRSEERSFFEELNALEGTQGSCNSRKSLHINEVLARGNSLFANKNQQKFAQVSIKARLDLKTRLEKSIPETLLSSK